MRIPKSFFADKSFTITYCGTTVRSTDVKTWDGTTFEVKNPTYTGIAIDGSFYDWQAVGMTMVGNGAVDKVAMVFDGDVYIYISMRVPWERRHCILSLISAKRRRQASVRAGSLR